MGQRANSGRNATLDEKKRRQAGRKQNEPEIRQIAKRDAAPGSGGAFGSGGMANRRGSAKAKLGSASERVLSTRASSKGR